MRSGSRSEPSRGLVNASLHRLVSRGRVRAPLRTMTLPVRPPKGTSIRDRFPNVARDWDAERNGALTPSEVAPASRIRVWWRCLSGHAYEVSVYSRVRSGGCRICSIPEKNARAHRTRVNKSRSVAEAFPRLLTEWHQIRNTLGPFELSFGSSLKVWWRCGKGHEW
jgi:hypothetical protein